jgi:hypothetical protein
MEGSGEDNDPQFLEKISQELYHSILQTESSLVVHL